MNKQVVDLESRIKALEIELSQLKASLIASVVVPDYTLADEHGSVSLKQLFAGRQDLLIVHNMGSRCPYCTAYADGFNGVLHHLLARTAFVVISPDTPEVQRKFAASRGWRFRMVSARGTSFSKDLGFEDTPGEHWPGASALRLQQDGTIQRTGFTSFDPGDKFSPIWPLFGLLDPQHGAEWEPKISYEDESAAVRGSASCKTC
jgi:predicted dithiol-disulfide oxidoreductase (DUF899 family)